MADVLLSLKHAVVHPGQNVSSDKYDSSQHLYHHPQVLLSPSGYSGSLCDQNFNQQPMFPSMSVNVSMNMTMHGYHPSNSYPTTEISCPQVSNLIVILEHLKKIIAFMITKDFNLFKYY